MATNVNGFGRGLDKFVEDETIIATSPGGYVLPSLPEKACLNTSTYQFLQSSVQDFM